MGRKEVFMQILEYQGMKDDPYWNRRIVEDEQKRKQNKNQQSLTFISKIWKYFNKLCKNKKSDNI